MLYVRDTFELTGTKSIKVKKKKKERKVHLANANQKKTEIAALISVKINFKAQRILIIESLKLISKNNLITEFNNFKPLWSLSTVTKYLN